MWTLRLGLVASHLLYARSQCLSVSCGLPHTRDSACDVQLLEYSDGWTDESPQALLQHSRSISQHQTVPALTDSADFVRDSLHGSPTARPARAASHVRKSFVHGGDAGEDHEKGRGDDEDHETGQTEDAHHHQHQHSPPSTTSTVIALMLVGMVAVVMSILYLVNYPHKNIQQVTWTILSSTISLFCAVLIFSALKAVMGMYLSERGIHSHNSKPDLTTTLISFVEFIFTFVLCQILMVLHRHRHYRLTAWATIGGHVTAFAAIECFGNLYHYSFSSSWRRGCLLVLLAFVVMWSLSSFASYVRSTYFSPESKPQQQLFEQECDDAGSEYVSLIIGLLISLLVRHMITGHLPPVHGSPRNKSQAEIWQLFAWATGLVVMMVMFTYAAHGELRKKHQAGSLVHLAQYTLSMSAGWCLLSWGQWLFWSSIGEYMSEPDKMLARMVMAIAFSALVFSFIFIFDLIASDYCTQFGMRAIISTMALVLGLAWEAVFTLSIESISGHYLDFPTQYIWCELGLTFCLCIVVLPAWVWYFLPRAEEAKLLAEEQMDISESPDWLN